MRTHILSKLKIDGREKILALEPHFDFYGITKAYQVLIDFKGEDGIAFWPSLTLTLEYCGETTTYELTVRFDSVRELCLPEMRPLFLLAEIEIEDVRDRMLEGISYEVISQFDRSFRCLCRDIEILDFKPA